MRKKISELIKGIMSRDVRTHASSIAFFFFMSFIPLLTLLASILPFFGISSGNVIRFFHGIFPDDSKQVVDAVILEAFDHSGAAFSISVIMLLWTASRGVSALTDGLNAMYDEKEERRFGVRTLLSFVYTLVLMGFMTVVIYLIFDGRIRAILRTFFPGIRIQSITGTFIEFLMLLLVGILFFCIVYRFLPAGRRDFLRQFPGAFIASAGWVLFSMGFRVYVSMFNSFTRFYGSLATVIVLLFWFYWIFFILLTGGYVNAHMSEIVPGRFLTLFSEEKKTGTITAALFVLGFIAFLSDCYLNWKFSLVSNSRYFIILLRIIAVGTWLAATAVLSRRMNAPIPRWYRVVLILLAAGNFILMRRALFPNVYIFLAVFAVWNAMLLLLCMNGPFRRKQGKAVRRR